MVRVQIALVLVEVLELELVLALAPAVALVLEAASVRELVQERSGSQLESVLLAVLEQEVKQQARPLVLHRPLTRVQVGHQVHQLLQVKLLNRLMS